jgi:drug/metabolite transporter (DMT)-like permease
VDIRNERLTLRVACLATLMAVLWGGNNIAIKFSLAGIPPFALAGIRFLAGSLIVLAWVFIERVSLKMESGEKGSLVLLAFLFTAQIGLLNVGVHHTLAGRATILISTHPFFIGIFAHVLIPGDRMKPLKILGMTLSFLGVVFILAESFVLEDFQYLLGDFLILGSALLLGLRLVYIKRLTQGIHPGRLLLWQSALSIPMFFLFSLIFEGNFVYQWNTEIAAGLFYQGVIIAGIGFIISTKLYQRYVASHLGVFHFVTPIIGVVFSNILLGEGISLGLIGSMVLVALGIAIVNRSE